MEDGKLTSKNTEAVDTEFSTTVIATNFGSDTEIGPVTISIHLTNIKFKDDRDIEVEEVGLLNSQTTVLTVEKASNSGDLKLESDVNNTEGITATFNSVTNKLTITTGENVGPAKFTIRESNGNSGRTIAVNCYNPKLDKTELSINSFYTKQSLGLVIEKMFKVNEDINTTIEWTSSDEDILKIEKDSKSTLKGIITPTGFGTANVFCKVLVTGKELTTLEIPVTVKDLGVNPPNIAAFNKEKTYYVSWDLTSSPYQINEERNLTEEPPENWYDYKTSSKHWANVKTTGGIEGEENDCYWVWIPRFAYKVPTRSATAETIEVKFLSGTSNIPIGETEEIEKVRALQGEWIVHPAFTNEGNNGLGELTGIWVAKFEASSNHTNVIENPTIAQLAFVGGTNTTTDLKVRIKPNVTSWRGLTMNTAFILCRDLKETGNSLEGSASNLDSHMIKNTEWGAVAYLSRSIYGKNDAVWNNSVYNNTTWYSGITGYCGAAQNTSQTNLTNTHKYNEEGAGNASTTGNVYGIYDMAGGAWEFVAGYLSQVAVAANYSEVGSADDKYKDKYAGTSATDTANYALNISKYGDAMYEISTNGTGKVSWDGDESYFTNSSLPIIVRGGWAGSAAGGGIFAFSRINANINNYTSFRPCLTIK